MSIVTVIVLAVLSIGAFIALLAQGLFHTFTCPCGYAWRWRRCPRCGR